MVSLDDHDWADHSHVYHTQQPHWSIEMSKYKDYRMTENVTFSFRFTTGSSQGIAQENKTNLILSESVSL